MKSEVKSGHVVALCGGVGGAKLALGLYRVLDPDQLSVIVNTGDDFDHLGLHISPDLDTVVYTLGGIADRNRGWGRAAETWNFMDALGRLGGETWFQLGDRDLATHVTRTQWLRDGGTLSEFASQTASMLGISARIMPMSDDRVRTIVETAEGDLPFQHYFVRRRCEPAVKRIRFENAAKAAPAPDVLELLSHPEVRAIVICPSNPYLSIDPILAIPAIRRALASTAPVIAVSPIISGQAVKGPTAKIMHELAIVVNTQAIATHYRGLIDALVIDEADAADRAKADVPIMTTFTMMKTLEDRERLARDVISFAEQFSRRPTAPRTAGGAP
jgi:LPPG:FO 2-phospho-L-lactate transferase